CAVAVLVDERASVFAPFSCLRHHPRSPSCILLHRPLTFSYLLDFFPCRFVLLLRTPPIPTPGGLSSIVRSRRARGGATPRPSAPVARRGPAPFSRSRGWWG